MLSEAKPNKQRLQTTRPMLGIASLSTNLPKPGRMDSARAAVFSIAAFAKDKKAELELSGPRAIRWRKLCFS